MSKQRVLQEVARRLADSEGEDEGAFIAVVICMIIAAFLMYKLFKAAVKVVRHSEGACIATLVCLCGVCPRRCRPSLCGTNQ